MSAARFAVVLGCSGPVGVGLMEALRASGYRVRGVCRSGRSETPQGVEIVAADVGEAEDARRVCAGADLIFGTMGLPYPDWQALWPRIADGMLAGAAQPQAKLVFADNLYCYGPRDEPLAESLPGTTFGSKPALRARLAAQLLEAHEAGRSRVALVRASDFYGPRVRNAMLGERVFPMALQGKPAQLVFDADQPHSYTYLPDLVRALIAVAEDDSAYGQAWHVPNAPALTTREVVQKVFELCGKQPRLQVLPGWAVSGIALFQPLFRELKEMRFNWDRPYVVDHAKFAAHFYDEFTPLEEGLKQTLVWYRLSAKAAPREEQPQARPTARTSPSGPS